LLTGAISDNHSGGAVKVCRETDLGTVCEAATALVATQAPTSTASVYDDVPAAPIAINSATFCGGGEITRTFTVTDEFFVGDVDLGLNGTHPYREDIVVELISPAGTHARVIAPSGTAYGFENYDVWLNDAVSQPLHDNTDDDPAEPYYDRAARPYEPLSVFNGEPVNGVWELRICDLNPALGDGAYNRARLSLTPQGAALSTAGTWSYPLPIIAGADGLTQILSIYAADGVGNRTTEAISLTYLLDVAPPALTVTGVSGQMQQLSPSPVLIGTVSDGGCPHRRC
jgi:subtilisin-like proprotein convertase family protein